MNTNDLKIFEAVAATGSFTRAAAEMFTVQSNVSARIKSLEEEFGVELIIRNSRTVTLTPHGQTLLAYSKKINNVIKEAKSEINNSDKINGKLHVGCIETTMTFKVPDILNFFEEKYPNVVLEFKSAIRNSLIDDVLNFDLDAAFVAGPINNKYLDQIKIKEEQLVIITASNGPTIEKLLKNNPVKIVVFNEGCVFRSRLESWLSSKGIIHYKNTELNSIEGIINFVEAGVGISLLPKEIISKYYPNRDIKIHTISKQLGTMNTVLIFRKEEYQSKALKAFIETYS